MTERDEHIEPLGGETAFAGRTFQVRVERFRHADGAEVQREIVRRQDAVAILAYDDERVWLVRQPREALGRWVLELPAGKLDVEGESPEQCARRELAEEAGLAAERWEEVIAFHPSSGYTDEHARIFAATGLRAEQAEGDEDGRIEVVSLPLSELDATIAACEDAKTIIGLQWLRARLLA